MYYLIERMVSSRRISSGRGPKIWAGSVSVGLALAFASALLVLVWAVGLAERTLEPWGDSARATYAGLADVLLGVGTVMVALAVRESRRRRRQWRVPAWLESLVYAASCIALAIPLAIGATNSLQASSIGAGGPSLALVAIGGVGLAAALALLARRGIRLAVIASIVLGGALTTFALIVPR